MDLDAVRTFVAVADAGQFSEAAVDLSVTQLAGSPAPATFVGEQTRLLWPADYDLRRVAVRDPTPVYPHSLIWRNDNPHPALAALRGYLGSRLPGHGDAGTWTPPWAENLLPRPGLPSL